MNLKEIWLKGMDSIHMAQDRDQWRALVNTVKEPSGCLKGGKFLD
jgi:hypothetical protein